jgi:hypothetical protein
MAKNAFFHHAPHSGRDIRIETVSHLLYVFFIKRPGIKPVKLANMIWAGGHAVPAADTP